MKHLQFRLAVVGRPGLLGNYAMEGILAGARREDNPRAAKRRA